MSTPTYDLLASSVLTTATSSVTFASLDTVAAGYRDLVLVVEARSNASVVSFFLQFNADTGNNYNFVLARGNGGAESTARDTNREKITLSTADGVASQSVLVLTNIMDFSAGKHKTVLFRSDRVGNGTEMGAGRYANTAAITQLRIFTEANQYAAGSTFFLYGIAS